MKLSKWIDITGLYPSFNINKLVYFASWRSHKKEKNAYKVYYITKAHEYEIKQFYLRLEIMYFYYKHNFLVGNALNYSLLWPLEKKACFWCQFNGLI